MAHEATRRSELERKEAKSRGPVTQILLALTLAASLIAVATMIYGMYNFPDAPIRQTAGGYEGKGGRARTQADFEAFINWEKAMVVVFPMVFVLGIGFAISDAKRGGKGEAGGGREKEGAS